MMCRQRNKTVNPFLSEYKYMAHKEKWKRNKIAAIFHWNLCKNYYYERSDNFYYIQKTESAEENQIQHPVAYSATDSDKFRV